GEFWRSCRYHPNCDGTWPKGRACTHVAGFLVWIRRPARIRESMDALDPRRARGKSVFACGRRRITRRSAQRAFAVPDSKPGFYSHPWPHASATHLSCGAKLHLESGITRPGVAVA